MCLKGTIGLTLNFKHSIITGIEVGGWWSKKGTVKYSLPARITSSAAVAAAAYYKKQKNTCCHTYGDENGLKVDCKNLNKFSLVHSRLQWCKGEKINHSSSWGALWSTSSPLDDSGSLIVKACLTYYHVPRINTVLPDTAVCKYNQSVREYTTHQTHPPLQENNHLLHTICCLYHFNRPIFIINILKQVTQTNN